MKIFIDCRYVRTTHHDGISRFTACLTEAMVPLATARGHELHLLISDAAQKNMLPDLPAHLVSSPTGPREPLVSLEINKLRPDVVFSPMQTIGQWGRKFPLVTTVHDLIYYENRTPPRDLPLPVRLLWRGYHLSWAPQRMLLNRADAVVAVSETTANLIRQHRLTKRPITVVPNGVDEPEGGYTAREKPVKKTLIYMGSFMPYKNVETLVRAMRRLPDYELHLLSKITPGTRERLQTLASDGRVIFHDGVSDAEYHALLADATALVTASVNEGFGIPLIEAGARGTPIVVSDIPIFREIAGGAAEYFSARSPEEFAGAVQRAAAPERWAELSLAGMQTAKKYTWDHSADVLLAELERLGAASVAQK